MKSWIRTLFARNATQVRRPARLGVETLECRVVPTTAVVPAAVPTNLALTGTAYRWGTLTGATADANRVPAPALNDGNLTNDVILSGAADDAPNAFEAAGVVWSSPRTVTSFTFLNGTFDPVGYDGAFDANLQLQQTADGTTWQPVSGWAVSPAYAYNSPAAGGQTYTFSGTAISALGVRVAGQVHSLPGNDSWYTTAREVQAFNDSLPPPPPPPGRGLTARYYNDPEFGTPTVTQTDPGVNFNFGTASPVVGVGGSDYSVRWTGLVRPRYSETYTFSLASAGSAQLLVDGRALVTHLDPHTATEDSGTITLVAGQEYTLQVDLVERTDPGSVTLSWSSLSQAKEVVPTDRLSPVTPTNHEAQIGVPVGPGTSDPSTKHLVRTSADVLYVFGTGATYYYGTPSGAGNSRLGVFKGDQPGSPSSFSTPDAIDAPAGGVDSVSVAIDGSDVVHVVWLNAAGQANYATFDTRTDHWGPTTFLANTGVSFGQGDEGVNVAVDATGTPTALWNFQDGTGIHIAYSKLVGGVWSSPVRVDDVVTNGGSYHPTVAFAPNGDFLVAWIDGNNAYQLSNPGLIRTRVLHVNGTWDASVAIPDTALSSLDNGPSLLITPDGTQHITFNNGANQIRYWYRPVGGSWLGDRQPSPQETHDPVLGPDGQGGLYIYGHGEPADDGSGLHRGYGPGKYRFHQLAGTTPWGPFTQVYSGPTDDATSTRWSQFFFNSPRTVDFTFWSGFDGGGNTYTLYVGTETPPVATSVALTTSVNPASLGTAVTFSATVSSTGGSPFGAVTFFDGATVLGTADLDATGKATFTTTALGAGRHSVTAVYAATGGFLAATAPAVVEQIGSLAPSVAVDAGGPAAGTFRADAGFSGGSTYRTTAVIDTTRASSPAPQAVYQSERYGSFSYALSGLKAGQNYTIRLHFAEIYWGINGRPGAGQRLQDVSINGTGVLSKFDIFAFAGGANRAFDLEFSAVATSSGRITVSFKPSAGSPDQNAKVSGIEAIPVTPVAAGDLYVANAGSATVERVDAAGNRTSFAKNLVNPAGIAFDQAGNLYVVERGDVRKFSSTGADLGIFVTLPRDALGLVPASGLAVDATGNVLVSLFNNTVRKYSPSGQDLGITATGLNNPDDLEVGPDGSIYVANRGQFGSGGITRIAPDGTVSSFGPGQIGGVAVAGDGSLFVTTFASRESGIGALVHLSASGALLGTVAANLNDPNDVDVAPDGSLYVIERGTGTVRRFSAAGQDLGSSTSGLTSASFLGFGSAGRGSSAARRGSH